MLSCFYLFMFGNGFLNPNFDALSHTGIHKQTTTKKRCTKGFTYIMYTFCWESEFSIYCFTCTPTKKKIW